MRGLIKITQSVQTQYARRDWQFLAGFAAANGLSDKAAELAPAPEWGWRRIDKRIGKLREELQAAGLNVPALPSTGN